MSRARDRPGRGPGPAASRSSSSTAGGWPSRGPATPSISGRHADLRRALVSGFPDTTLSASGRDVGLPDGQMGNSEVGHLNLGAGSVVTQDLARIDGAIADGSFFENEVLRRRLRARPRRARAGRLHLLGLVSDGGVHSGWEHIEACIELAAREGVPDVVLHALTDGRDTSPTGGAAYMEEVERWLRSAGPRRHGRRPLLGDGPRLAAGSARSSPTTRSSTREGSARRAAAEAIARRLRGRRHRRVHQADRDRRLRRDGGRRRRPRLQLPPRPDAPDRRRARRSGLRRFRPRRRARPRRDDDGRATAPSGSSRWPSRPTAPDDHDRRGDQRGGRRRSSTSPRPRSTPT